MSNTFSWEENNRRYAEAMAALKAKGDGKCYCPCNDCRGLRTIIILLINYKHLLLRSAISPWTYVVIIICVVMLY